MSSGMRLTGLISGMDTESNPVFENAYRSSCTTPSGNDTAFNAVHPENA